jgi:hypothetical protein
MLVDSITLTAAKRAAIAAMTIYNEGNNRRNECALKGTTSMEHVIKFTSNDGREESLTFDREEDMALFVVGAGVIKDIERHAAKWRRQAAEVGDRELSCYYLEKAVKAEGDVKRYRELAANGNQDVAKAAWARTLGKGAVQVAKPAANNPPKRVNNDMANESQRRAYLAHHDREAESAHQCMLSTSNRDVVSHYSRKERDHRAQAELHRARSDGHRRAAAAF